MFGCLDVWMFGCLSGQNPGRRVSRLEIEIISQEIDNETIENKFDIFETGTYKLIIKSTSNEESLVVGSIGPLPDTNKMFLRYISMSVLLSGLIGLVGTGIYAIKNRRSI